MLVNIQNADYPFSSFAGPSSKIVLARKRHQLDSAPHSVHLLQKIIKLTGLPLVNLINIRFLEQDKQCVDLYYQSVGQTLLEVLGGVDAEGVKLLHRQFIELVIGLAKAGVVTKFRGECCGAITQNDEVTIKYYLDPSQVMLTQDLEVVEQEVTSFCAQAMQYMQQNCQLAQPKLISSLQEKELTHSLEINTSLAEKLQMQQESEDMLNQSKHSGFSSSKAEIGMPKNRKQKKDDCLRKLSLLSKELSEISARHRGIRDHFYLPTESKLSINSRAKKQRKKLETATKNSQYSYIQNGQFHPSVPNPLLLARSKMAQNQLSLIKERMAPYGQVYTILNGIKAQ